VEFLAIVILKDILQLMIIIPDTTILLRYAGISMAFLNNLF